MFVVLTHHIRLDRFIGGGSRHWLSLIFKTIPATS